MRPAESYRAYRKKHENGPYEGKWSILSEKDKKAITRRYSGGTRRGQKSKYRIAHDGSGFIKTPDVESFMSGIGVAAALSLTQSFVKALRFARRGRR